MINIPLLFYRSFSPASENVNYYRFLNTFAADQKRELICFGVDVYSDVSLPINFYRSPNIETIILEDRAALITYLQTAKPAQVYVYEYGPMYGVPYEGYTEKVLYAIIPEWVKRINFNRWVNRTKTFKIKALTRK